MNYNFFIVYILQFFFLLFLLDISKIICTISYTNPMAISLTNGNIFIIHKTGIDFSDKYLNKIKTLLIFSNDEQIATNKLSKISISKFDDGGIICLINNYSYIFNNESILLFKDIQININNYDYYSVIGDVNYYYYITFIDDNIINIYCYFYDRNNNRTNFLYHLNTFENSLKKVGLSCHIMKHKTKGEMLACFYITTNNNLDYLRIKFFKKETMECY